MALHADEHGNLLLYRWRWILKATPAWWDYNAHRLPLLMDVDHFLVQTCIFLGGDEDDD